MLFFTFYGRKDVLLTDLKQLANTEIAEHSYRFFKAFKGGYGEGDQFLGIRVPEQRKVSRRYKKLPLDEVADLLQNPFHEVRLTALFILTDRSMKADPSQMKDIASVYLDNISGVNNWDLVDSSAPYILGKYFHNKEKKLLYEFAQSEDLWKKRISIITCFYFIKQNEYSDALAISKSLISDNHDLIHKAVGWMLREIGKRNQVAEISFLMQYYREMPRTMLRYAIEHFDEELRQKYLKGKI